MNSIPLNRRAFLKFAREAMSGSAVVLTLPMILSACREAREQRLNGVGWQTLSEAEALELDAIAARILPDDETPGAREAGVVFFMDNVLGDDREEELLLLRDGLRNLQAEAASAFSGARFHQLDDAQQDALLRAVETTPFFATVRFLTIAGMFSLPEYGGNRDLAGYRLIGFEERHAWAPPFGHYDADYMEKGQ